MTRDQSRHLLKAYRENGGEAEHFAQALAAAQNDPELKQWLDDELQTDAALRVRLRAVPVPADLRQKILAAVQKQSATPGIIPFYRHPVVLSMAACLMVALGLALYYKSHVRPAVDQAVARLRFNDFTHDAFAFVQSDWSLQYEGGDQEKVREWLRAHHAPADYIKPGGLEKLQGLGCRTLDWKGQKVSVICFLVSPGKEVHLLVINRDVFGDSPPAGRTFFASAGKWSRVAWTDENKAYLMAGDVPLEEIKKLLE
ncbi:MAG: hypothetical protein SFY92_07900 [Verrucomicrobiae bacterium]|nr:hypothetical protein [Verrucomicrobiae bacterium]